MRQSWFESTRGIQIEAACELRLVKRRVGARARIPFVEACVNPSALPKR
jgi:hypothetical protein